tara:strand:+ start:916 stop:1854 length:939 start_codon:yes stop_codon:yes gene_type:complete
MSRIDYFESKKTNQLFGMNEYFDFLKSLSLNDKFPKVILMSGNKGIGKSTLINHLMHFIFDKHNYDNDQNIFKKNTDFDNQYNQNIFQNIIYLSGSNFSNIKVENIRNLKSEILKSSLNNSKRFIILDDVEIFNNNSLNALLKLIEEPNKSNYFILINNKSKPLKETIKSRCIEIKCILNDSDKTKITSSLINYFKQNIIFDYSLISITPGNFIKYNYFFEKNNLDLNDNFKINLTKLLNLYKKEKDIFFLDLVLFYVDYYFQKLKDKNIYNNKLLIEDRSFIAKSINDFFLFNLNQNTLLNHIENKIIHHE